ncbi:hypothetical protein G4120_001253 [Campylobacter coli]|nr:hypothetical protein [Campylobacter coli]EGC9796005.1 hypothetical protein [Campylobacter coli]
MELTRPFAENGDRQDFPVDTQGDGTMSLQQGFGAFYGLPPEEGGLFIDRTKFNQLMYLVSKGVIDNKTAIGALESQYGSLLTSSAKLLTKNLNWTVGTGGDYEDLKTAINEASKYINFSNYTITIRLKNSLRLSGLIQIAKVNIPFVNLDFNGFSLNYGLVFNNSIFGEIIKANINSSGNCIHAKNNSEIILTDNIILNGYDGIVSSVGSKVTYLNSSNNNNNNITINCQSDRYGIYANLGGKIEVQNSNIECNNGTALFALTGGIINANSSVITGTSTQSNISFNTFTNNGYILK